MYIYLIAWIFICIPGFHAALLGQSSGCEISCLRNQKKSKNTARQMFTLTCVSKICTGDC